MAYIPYFSDSNVVKEWVNKTFNFYITAIPSIFCNYYNLDKDASNVSNEGQTLTDIHMNYHQLKYKLFHQQPLLLNETTTSRTASESTITSITNDPIQVTTITIEPLLQPTAGDKIVIDLDSTKLINREGLNVFTVEQIEYATQQRLPINVVRLIIRRDLDFSNETEIPQSVLSGRYALLLPYIGYIDFSNYTTYLQLVTLAEDIKQEIQSRYITYVLSNKNLSVEKEYVRELSDILSQIVNYSPNIDYDGILRAILIPELVPDDKGIDLLNDLLDTMTSDEIIHARKYNPEIYQFDSFYKLSSTGNSIPLLPEFQNYLTTTTLPSASDLLNYSTALQSLTTIELAQLITLIDLVIRSWII